MQLHVFPLLDWNALLTHISLPRLTRRVYKEVTPDCQHGIHNQLAWAAHLRYLLIGQGVALWCTDRVTPVARWTT